MSTITKTNGKLAAKLNMLFDAGMAYKAGFRLVKTLALKTDLYQRNKSSGSQNKIRSRDWNPALAGVLIVAKRDDGSLWLLDGLQRTCVAIELEIEYLWAMIVGPMPIEEEADLFTALNTMRSALSSANVCRGQYFAKDKAVMDSVNSMRSYGFQESFSGMDITDNDLCITNGQVIKLYKKAESRDLNAAEIIDGLFDVLHSSFVDGKYKHRNEMRNIVRWSVLKGFGDLFLAKPDLDRSRLKNILKTTTATSLLQEAVALQARRRKTSAGMANLENSIPALVTECLATMYNKGMVPRKDKIVLRISK
jgi:hypothetical protein